MKLAFIGNFYKSYKSSTIVNMMNQGPGTATPEDLMIAKLFILDQADHMMKDKDTRAALALIQNLSNKDQKVRAILDPWIQKAQNRLHGQMIIDTLTTHSDAIVKQAYG